MSNVTRNQWCMFIKQLSRVVVANVTIHIVARCRDICKNIITKLFSINFTDLAQLDLNPGGGGVQGYH